MEVEEEGESEKEDLKARKKVGMLLFLLACHMLTNF